MVNELATPILTSYSEKKMLDIGKKFFDSDMRKVMGKERIIQYCMFTEESDLIKIANFIRTGNRNSQIPSGMRGKEHSYQLIHELEKQELWWKMEVVGCETSIDVVGYFKGDEKPFKKLMSDGSVTEVNLKGLNGFEAKMGPTLKGEYAERALFQIRQMGLLCSPQNVNLYITKDIQIEPELYKELTKRGESILVSELDTKDIDERVLGLSTRYRKIKEKTVRPDIRLVKSENLSECIIDKLGEYGQRGSFNKFAFLKQRCLL